MSGLSRHGNKRRSTHSFSKPLIIRKQILNFSHKISIPASFPTKWTAINSRNGSESPKTSLIQQRPEKVFVLPSKGKVIGLLLFFILSLPFFPIGAVENALANRPNPEIYMAEETGPFRRPTSLNSFLKRWCLPKTAYALWESGERGG